MTRIKYPVDSFPHLGVAVVTERDLNNANTNMQQLIKEIEGIDPDKIESRLHAGRFGCCGEEVVGYEMALQDVINLIKEKYLK